MPLFRPITYSKNITLGLWSIEEDYDTLYNKVQSYGFDMSIISPYKSEIKRIQWLAARMLFHELDPQIKKIYYKENGAPYITNGAFISMSHSNKMVSVIIDNQVDTGVDIQFSSHKILNIKEKFASINELNYVKAHDAMIQFGIIWSAKEAVYKRMKIEGLIFSQEIEIEKFDIGQTGLIKAIVNHKEIRMELELKYEILKDYTFVYTSIP